VALIAITGTKPRSDLAHSEFQDIDQSRLFAAGGLSYSVTVSDPLQLVAVMRDAVATALTHHCCVHVGVPVDIQGALLSAPEHLCSANPAEMKRRVEAQIGDPDDIAGIAELLASGKERVVFAVGLAARQDGEAILRLAEMTASPVVTRLDAKGAIDESHPLALGVVGVHGKPPVNSIFTPPAVNRRRRRARQARPRGGGQGDLDVDAGGLLRRLGPDGAPL